MRALMGASRVRRAVLATLATASLSACGSSRSASPITTLGDRLRSDALVFVAVPSDGRYGSTTYAGSGEAVASSLQAALLHHASRVERGTAYQDLNNALATARAQGADYAFVPVIVHWEDRATEWSGLPDRIEVIVTVHDAQSGRILARSSLKGRSSWWTPGGDQPQDLLAGTTADLVDGLFGGQPRGP